MWMLFLSSFINFCSFLRCFMKFDERNLKNLKIPLFYGNCGKICSIDSDFFKLISLHYLWMWQETLLQNFVKLGVNLTFFAPWLPWQRSHFEILHPPKAATHYGVYSYKVSWSLMKGIQCFFKSPFFVSMATAAKFVKPIPIVLAYLVPLGVDVVPIKFHKFLFGE